MDAPKDPRAETELVERCMAGDRDARDQLVRTYSPDLLEGVLRCLALARHSAADAEDIGEQFWTAMVFNDFWGLRRFNVRRGGLGGYLYVLGRQEASIWLRQQPPEDVYLKPAELDALADPASDVLPAGMLLEEFLGRLPPKLRAFCQYRLGDPSPFRPEDYSPKYRAVLRHWLRSEWEKFVRDRSGELSPGMKNTDIS